MTSTAKWRKRTRWSEDEARALLQEQERSGLSVMHFAEVRGLEAERLYRWRKKLRQEPKRVQFVEVRAEATGAPIEIVLATGHRIVVRAPVDVATLRAIVGALEPQC